MRLRLIIERHSLPPVKVVWTVGRVLPPLANAGASYTISQLLKQINQTIPLQSDQWSLEDYVVETAGFECLHFSQIDDALSNDDEVLIRPLQRADLRDRKISGRHQTTATGRHLIDGVPFGRRSASAEARPSVEIPPRKKRRIEPDKHDDSDTVSGDGQIVLRPSPDDENCDGRTIDERYRLAKVSARDERLGLFALYDGRGSSPESATFSDDQTLSTLSSDDDSREASPVTTFGHDLGNWVRPIDDSFEPNKPMTIHQLHLGESDDSGSSDEDYGPSDESTDVNNIGNSENIAESSHYSEDHDSECAEDHSVSLEDGAPPSINSSRGEDSEEEIGVPTNIQDPYYADLDDDDYSADAELDLTNESIYESEENMESGSGKTNCSSDDGPDARDHNPVNIRDLFLAELDGDYSSDTDFDPVAEAAADSAAESEENMEDSFEGSNGSSNEGSDATIKLDSNNMGIRDLYYLDFEVNYSSDEEFDPAAQTGNESEENMEDSDDSNDADSDYTDDPNAFAMTILDLVRKGDIDDRSSDEEYEPTDEDTEDDKDGPESDKENSEQKIQVGVSGSSSTSESDEPAKKHSNSSPLPTRPNPTTVNLKMSRHSTQTVWGDLAPGQLHQLTEIRAPSSSVTLRGDSITISNI